MSTPRNVIRKSHIFNISINISTAGIDSTGQFFESIQSQLSTNYDVNSLIHVGETPSVAVRLSELLDRAAEASVVTPKPANGGQGKTGQREEAGDSVVLSCRLLWWQVYFRTPTPGTTFEYMTVMEKTIEHGGDGGAISQ